MEILKGCGLGPKLRILLHRFGDDQVVVPKAGRYYGHPFRTEIGVTQGDSVSPIFFNVVVDAVVRSVLLEVCGF